MMTDISSKQKTKFTQKDRLYISKTVSALVPVQFNELVFSLEPPPGVVPEQGDRTYALLQWVESPTGPGLEAIEDYLQSVIPKYARVSKRFMTITLPVEYASLTEEQKNKLAQKIKEIVGVTVDLFEEGSVKITVSGSEGELEKLQQLFERNHLSLVLDDLPVESVQELSSNTTASRKARLIEMLRFRSARALAHVLARDLARARAIDLNLARDRAIAIARALDIDLATDLDRATAHAIAADRAIATDSALAIDLARAITRDLARAIDLALDTDLDSARVRAGAVDLVHAIAHALDRDLALDSKRSLDLSQTDLSGANLRGLYLVGVDLTDTNLVDALVEGTIFGENPGLTQSDKDNLISRGAIFVDDPGSNVPGGVSERR